MEASFFSRRMQRFTNWWRAPVTVRDRVTGVLVGGAGCLVVAVLGRLMLGPLPVSIGIVGLWALAGAVTGGLGGCVFPKVTACVFFPFATFGASS